MFKSINIKNKKGITLIALVITIIVILILAGISISMLSQDNSILKQAGRAKEETEIKQIEEAIKIEYMNLVGTDLLNNGNSATVEQAIENIIARNELKDRIVKMNGGSGTATLSTNTVIVGIASPNNMATITIETDDSAGSDYYAVISGKNYKILIDNEDVEIERIPTDFSEGESGSSGAATGVTVADTSKATASLSGDKKTITITGVAEGNTTITVEGINKTASIEVVSSIAEVDLDGAIIPGTLGTGSGNTTLSFTNEQITQGNQSIATVTNEGVIKCGSKTGTTTVKINGEVYRITSTAKTVSSSNVGNGAPEVPTGFTAIDTEDAKWSTATAETSKGLVIMDGKGNQFVWVPVTSLNSMFMCTNSNKNGHTCNIELSSDRNSISCTSEGHSEQLCGKLYATVLGDKFSSATTGQTYTEGNGIREPDILKGTNYGDWCTTEDRGLNLITRYVEGFSEYDLSDSTDVITLKNEWTNQLKTEFYKMALSVAKSGGFFIGRYETSLINGETRVVAGATSMSNETDSAGTWYGLYQKQKDFISSSSLKSNMIWGCQYDAMMNWIGDDSKIKDNSGSNRNYDSIRRTGVVSNDKINNVYDLYGLRREWTMEASGAVYRVSRGGYYSSSSAPSSRINDTSRPYLTTVVYGSRPSLYIQ